MLCRACDCGSRQRPLWPHFREYHSTCESFVGCRRADFGSNDRHLLQQTTQGRLTDGRPADSCPAIVLCIHSQFYIIDPCDAVHTRLQTRPRRHQGYTCCKSLFHTVASSTAGNRWAILFVRERFRSFNAIAHVPPPILQVHEAWWPQALFLIQARNWSIVGSDTAQSHRGHPATEPRCEQRVNKCRSSSPALNSQDLSRRWQPHRFIRRMNRFIRRHNRCHRGMNRWCRSNQSMHSANESMPSRNESMVSAEPIDAISE